MTREDALLALAAAEKNNRDKEGAHIEADEVLCDLLIELGYQDVVDAWLKVDKWYA